MSSRPPRDRRRQRLWGAAVAFAWAGVAPLAGTAAAEEAGARVTEAVADHTVGEIVGEIVDVVLAVAAAERFLDRTVVDGRVVRTDQGGDTVSEGQAYALLVTAAIGDEERFRSVWRWTSRHLRREDGLFAWHWDDGEVRDPTPAADADLLMAAALSIGAERFGDLELDSQSRLIASAVIAHETAAVDDRRVLFAGPWAVAGGIANPSYWAPTATERLRTDAAGRSIAATWAEIDTSWRSMLDELTATWPHLPPDWVVVTPGDGAEPATSPSGDSSRYGWDAVRVPVQLAADCDPDGRAIAARAWPFLDSLGRDVGAVRHLDGAVLDGATHPAALVGAAGAATAAGAVGAASDLLAAAEGADATTPTYYGAAWIALGRLWLTTGLLGGCAAPSVTDTHGR